MSCLHLDTICHDGYYLCTTCGETIPITEINDIFTNIKFKDKLNKEKENEI